MGQAQTLHSKRVHPVLPLRYLYSLHRRCKSPAALVKSRSLTFVDVGQAAAVCHGHLSAQGVIFQYLDAIYTRGR